MQRVFCRAQTIAAKSSIPRGDPERISVRPRLAVSPFWVNREAPKSPPKINRKAPGTPLKIIEMPFSGDEIDGIPHYEVREGA